MPVRAVVVDVNGTLFPASAAASAFSSLGLDPGLAKLWMAEVLRDGFAAQLAGVYAPFSDFAEHRLAAHLEAAGKAQPVGAALAAKRVLEAWAAAEPYADVGRGLTALQLGGIKVAALTNGSRHLARSVLQRAGVNLADMALFDIDEPKAWKPSGEAYRFVVNALLLAPDEVMLVAAHAWDCHGALQAGLKACFVQRDAAEPYPPFLDQPHHIVKSFEELEGLLVGL